MNEGNPNPLKTSDYLSEFNTSRPVNPSSSRLSYIRKRVRSIINQQDSDTARFTGKPAEEPYSLRLHRGVRQFGLEEKVAINEMTGLLNRAPYESVRNKFLGLTERDDSIPSVQGIRLDIDHFGNVNKEKGQGAGNRMLEQMGNIILESIRETDMAGRIGGEEFEITAPRTKSPIRTPGTIAIPLSEKIRFAIEEAEFEDGQRLTVSIGVTEYKKGEGYKTYDERLENAQVTAKRLGRNRAIEARLIKGKYAYIDHTTGKKYRVERDSSGNINDPIEIR